MKHNMNQGELQPLWIRFSHVSCKGAHDRIAEKNVKFVSNIENIVKTAKTVNIWLPLLLWG